MSLPKRIYELGKAIANSDLVLTKSPTPQNIAQFRDLLNQSFPVDEKEAAQRELVRSMYYCNPFGFLQYISISRNRVKALILWTESKRIARFFELNRCVHISWNETTGLYDVVLYVPRDNSDVPTAVPTPAAPQTQKQRTLSRAPTAVLNRTLNPNAKSYSAAVQTVYAEPQKNTSQDWADAE